VTSPRLAASPRVSRDRAEAETVASGPTPELADLAAEIADLEQLIEQRPARAATLRAAIEELRSREDDLHRAAKRSTRGLPPAREGCRGSLPRRRGGYRQGACFAYFSGRSSGRRGVNQARFGKENRR
jgi:hypothetical protein